MAGDNNPTIAIGEKAIAKNKESTKQIAKQSSELKSKVKGDNNQIDQSVTQINVSMSKCDVGALVIGFESLSDTFAKFPFAMFVARMTELTGLFIDFRKTVTSVNKSITALSKKEVSISISEERTTERTEVDVESGVTLTAKLEDNDAKNIQETAASLGQSFEGAAGAVGGAAKDIGTGFKDVGTGMKDVGTGFKDVGAGFVSIAEGLNGSVTALNGLATALPAAANGFMAMCSALDGAIKYIPQIIVFGGALYGLSVIGQDLIPAGEALASIGGGMMNIATSIGTFASGLGASASAIALLIPLLPALGASMLQMAANMAGLLEYLPELLIFLGIMLVLSLLGEGLMMAGQGLVNIGLGLTTMTEGMMMLLEFMPIFIESLAGITDNVGGIILFVLLAAAMLAMAIAMQMMNEQMTQFVGNMTTLTELISVGFVAAFVIFGLMLIGMSFFMDKVASGMDKITNAMKKQITQLAILNPLLAAKAILENWIMGAVTVALAIAGALAVKFAVPAMATGGVVSSPTMALVGEGRYPEAVVPLGDSPQFASMKSDIANAVIQGMMAVNGMSASRQGGAMEVVLNVDGTKLARAVLPNIEKERSRGYTMKLQGV